MRYIIFNDHDVNPDFEVTTFFEVERLGPDCPMSDLEPDMEIQTLNSLLEPTWTAFSDYTAWTGLLCSTVFHF